MLKQDVRKIIFAECIFNKSTNPPIWFLYAVFGDCPPSGQHTSCLQKCMADSDCTSMGGKCCPNLCNYRSCAIPKQGGSTDKYKGCKYTPQSLTLHYFNTQIFLSKQQLEVAVTVVMWNVERSKSVEQIWLQNDQNAFVRNLHIICNLM